MEYPGSRFNNHLRRLLLIAFVAGFFITAPTLILYSAGYRYDWRYGFLRETGSISIDILPKNATAYLDGLKLQDSMPIRVNNITPHTYTLRITAPGYYDWQKDVEIKSKQTVYIKEISLIQKNKPVLLLTDSIDAFALSANDRYIAYTKKINNTLTLWLYDITTADQTLIATLPFTDAIISWSPQDSYFVVTPTTAPYAHILLFDATNPLTSPIDPTVASAGPITKVQWKTGNTSELYFSTSNGLYSVVPQTRQQFTLSTTPYLDWYMEQGQLWTLNFTTTTSQLTIIKDTLGFKSIAADVSSYSAENLATTAASWRILAAHNGTLALATDKPDTVLLVHGNERYTLDGDNIQISPYGNWWLISTPWELWTYSEGEEPYLLIRSGEPLKTITILDQYNTLGLITKTTNALFPYYFVENELIDSPVTAAVAASDQRILYYTNKKGLWKLSY